MAVQVARFDLQLTFPSYHSLPVLFCEQEISCLQRRRDSVQTETKRT